MVSVLIPFWIESAFAIAAEDSEEFSFRLRPGGDGGGPWDVVYRRPVIAVVVLFLSSSATASFSLSEIPNR